LNGCNWNCGIGHKIKENKMNIEYYYSDIEKSTNKFFSDEFPPVLKMLIKILKEGTNLLTHLPNFILLKKLLQFSVNYKINLTATFT
jgi:hypothetical protein